MLKAIHDWFTYKKLIFKIMRMENNCFHPVLTSKKYEKYRELRALEWTVENLYKDGFTEYNLSLVNKRLFEIRKRYELW